MQSSVVRALRDQIRGITGALLVVGVTFHYTMETWWWGWTLPLTYLVGYAFIGLTLIMVITRHIGFHEAKQDRRGQSYPWWYVSIDFAEILTQSFVASYVILLLLGIIDLTSSLDHVVRLGLIEVVPLGFGAAMANRLFGTTGEEEAEKELQFPRNIAIFTVGALFVSSTIAPTQEMELISAHMGWVRHFMLIASTLVMIYLVLYELEFKDQHARVKQSKRLQIGTVFLVYMVGTTTAFLMLLSFGHFIDATVALVYQETVVLAFPAAIGAAAAEMVI